MIFVENLYIQKVFSIHSRACAGSVHETYLDILKRLHLQHFILVEVNGARSYLDLSNAPFALWNLADLAKVCMYVTQDFSVLKSPLTFIVC